MTLNPDARRSCREHEPGRGARGGSCAATTTSDECIELLYCVAQLNVLTIEPPAGGE